MLRDQVLSGNGAPGRGEVKKPYLLRSFQMYDGSDAGLYYKLKQEREERKWEKRREKLQENKDKD